MTSEKGRLKGEKRSNAIIAHIALYASLSLLTLTITKTKAQDSVQLQTDSLQSVPSVITDTVSAVRISATKLIDASTSLQGNTACIARGGASNKRRLLESTSRHGLSGGLYVGECLFSQALQ